MHVSAPGGAQVPLSMFARHAPTETSLAVNHHSQFVASTISFNLPEGVSLSQATRAIDDALARIGVPTTVRGSFQGSARAFRAVLETQPILILAALLTLYIVLGVLYESWIHPLTILSTLPSAGVGALVALMLFRTEFSVIALIGVIMLIGIVQKNAIMMIDFALATERRTQGESSRDAIFEACLLRFRPILMTTLAALLAVDSARARQGRRRGAPPAARHRDRRRPDPEPAPDPLHDADRVSLPRPLQPVGPRPAARRASAAPRSRPARRNPDDDRRARTAPFASSPSRPRSRAGVSCTVGPDYVRPRRRRAAGVQGSAERRTRAEPERAAARPLVGASSATPISMRWRRRSTSTTRRSAPPRRACGRRRR